MLGIGMLLLIVGVAIVMPSGSTPGSVAHRVVRINLMNAETTPGHRRWDGGGWRRSVLRIALGLTVVAAGLWCMSIGWPDGV